MATTLESKACEACAKAKRRCDRELPHCLRCRGRAIECTYPPTKPTCFVLCEGDDPAPVTYDILPCDIFRSSKCYPVVQDQRIDTTRQTLGLGIPGFSSDLVDNRLYSSWFTSSETWEIDRFLKVEHNPFSVMGLKRLIIKIHQWLTDWVEKGSNPFIHSRLYKTRFPRCVQDAYTALSCYLHKTASNEQTIFHIIEDRAKQLVLEHSTLVADPLLADVNSSSVTIDSFEHLSRVHALLIYQVLCLYDGDIRLRHVAESHIPVLTSWMEEMVEHASHAVCLGDFLISSTQEQTEIGSSLSDIAHCENLLWYSWILAESIRRTWLVAAGIQGTYLVIQQGRPVPCQGGMMFTTRQGVWDAQSAMVWEKLCSEVNVGFMQVAEADRLFTEVTPEHVDDFTLLILQATFGEEKMERWRIQRLD